MSTLTAVHYMSKWVARCFGGTARAKDIKEREHRCWELDGQQHEWHPEAESWAIPFNYTRSNTQAHLQTGTKICRNKLCDMGQIIWDYWMTLCLFSEIESKTNPIYAQRRLWRWWETQRSGLNIMQKLGKIRGSTVSPEIRSPSA